MLLRTLTKLGGKIQVACALTKRKNTEYFTISQRRAGSSWRTCSSVRVTYRSMENHPKERTMVPNDIMEKQQVLKPELVLMIRHRWLG